MLLDKFKMQGQVLEIADSWVRNELSTLTAADIPYNASNVGAELDYINNELSSIDASDVSYNSSNVESELDDINADINTINSNLSNMPSYDLLGYVLGGSGENTVQLENNRKFSDYNYVYIAFIKNNNHYAPTSMPLTLFNGHQTTISIYDGGVNVYGYVTPIDDTHITALSSTSGYTIACYGFWKK